jgi:hypothetical protein
MLSEGNVLMLYSYCRLGEVYGMDVPRRGPVYQQGRIQSGWGCRSCRDFVKKLDECYGRTKLSRKRHCLYGISCRGDGQRAWR